MLATYPPRSPRTGYDDLTLFHSQKMPTREVRSHIFLNHRGQTVQPGPTNLFQLKNLEIYTLNINRRKQTFKLTVRGLRINTRFPPIVNSAAGNGTLRIINAMPSTIVPL
jgi:hypothetical protein